MKTKILFTITAIIALTMTISCSKEPNGDKNTRESAAITQYVTPDITCANNPGNHIYEIADPAAGQNETNWSTNFSIIPVEPLTGQGYAICEVDSQGKTSSEFETIGSYKVRLTWTQAPQYTTDKQFFWIQNMKYKNHMYTDKWEGPIEEYFTYRIRGTQGTKYIDLTGATPADLNACNYIKGEVTEISGITEDSDIEFSPEAVKTFWGWSSSPQYYNVQYVDITILTDQSESVTITVYGKRRASEMANMLNIVKVGDNVEMLADITSQQDVTDRNFAPIHTSNVLKL